jgi:hypothetical protein
MAPKRYEAPIYNPPKPVGRPRKAGISGDSGHSLGTGGTETQASSGIQRGATVTQTNAPVGPVLPRLLDLHSASLYLGISEYTVRELESQGIIARVRIPLPNHGELRKLLFDKQDLDRLVEHWKDISTHA